MPGSSWVWPVKMADEQVFLENIRDFALFHRVFDLGCGITAFTGGISQFGRFWWCMLPILHEVSCLTNV